jgi:hypothetical protein
VVKKAVAPAMRNGSFFKSSLYAFRNNSAIETIKYLFLIVVINHEFGNCMAILKIQLYSAVSPWD